LKHHKSEQENNFELLTPDNLLLFDNFSFVSWLADSCGVGFGITDGFWKKKNLVSLERGNFDSFSEKPPPFQRPHFSVLYAIIKFSFTIDKYSFKFNIYASYIFFLVHFFLLHISR
jgi:hypothetical protein